MEIFKKEIPYDLIKLNYLIFLQQFEKEKLKNVLYISYLFTIRYKKFLIYK